MMPVNVQLKISRGIFAYGKILQTYTIHESKSTVTNQVRTGAGPGRGHWGDRPP